MQLPHAATTIANTSDGSTTFVRLSWSNLFAQLAEQVSLAATPIIAVLLLGGGVAATGWLQTAQTLPFLLAAIPAGVLADWLPLRRLLLGAELLRLIALLLMLGLAWGGSLNLPMLALLGFLGACGTVLYSVSAPAIIPHLVPRENLPHANARIELTRTLAFAGGPVLAGAMAGWAGGTWAFVCAATFSALALVLMTGLPVVPPASRPRRTLVRDIAEGAAFVWRNPLLRPVFATQFVFALAFFMLQAAYVPYAVAHLGLDGPVIGRTLAAYGAGMLAGAICSGRLLERLPFGMVIGIGPVSAWVASMMMVVSIWVPSAWWTGASFFLMGAGPILWVISTTTLRQRITPAELLGRVSAINVLAYGARPVGAALGALVGSVLGVQACILLAAVGFFVQAVIIVRSPAVRLTTTTMPLRAIR